MRLDLPAPATRPARALLLALVAACLAACGADPAPRDDTPSAADAPAARDSAPDPAAPRDTDRAPPSRPRVVLLTQSKGYEHAVVQRPSPEEPSLVERVLAARWSPTHEVELLRDAAELDAERLARTDVLVMYTTGELPVPGGAAALVEWVASGGALLGVHSVSDTFQADPAWAALVGGAFDGHPWHQPVRLQVVDRSHPATAHLGATLELADEIYEYRARTDDRHLLLRLDPASVDLTRAKHPDSGHPLTWTRTPGQGRLFHTGLGHREELWSHPDYLQHLDGALSWLTQPD